MNGTARAFRARGAAAGVRAPWRAAVREGCAEGGARARSLSGAAPTPSRDTGGQRQHTAGTRPKASWGQPLATPPRIR